MRRRTAAFEPLYGPMPEDLLSAKRELRDRLFGLLVESEAVALRARRAKCGYPDPAINLVGVGIGEQLTAGKRTGERCMKVLVAKKFPLYNISHAHRIPASIAGIPSDIEAVGYPKKLALLHRRRHRPIVAGVSVGLDQNAVPDTCAGTLGRIVTGRDDAGLLFALSNNHVLANENRADLGAVMIQPGSLDGGQSQDQVGRLTRFAKIQQSPQ